MFDPLGFRSPSTPNKLACIANNIHSATLDWSCCCSLYQLFYLRSAVRDTIPLSPSKPFQYNTKSHKNFQILLSVPLPSTPEDSKQSFTVNKHHSQNHQEYNALDFQCFKPSAVFSLFLFFFSSLFKEFCNQSTSKYKTWSQSQSHFHFSTGMFDKNVHQCTISF